MMRVLRNASSEIAQMRRAHDEVQIPPMAEQERMEILWNPKGRNGHDDIRYSNSCASLLRWFVSTSPRKMRNPRGQASEETIEPDRISDTPRSCPNGSPNPDSETSCPPY